ncbi:MAG: DedA family protein [Gammaproteobacteria bacterium]|nr:DedA family protein [Gammaproteobacteria bacterium]
MRMFSKMYDKVLVWAKHRRASYYLAGLSFTESSFFPVPPDVMLAPMCLANPSRALHFAMITTIFSVLGGAFGYFIGVFGFDLVEPIIQANPSYQSAYETAVRWFGEWGVWVVFIAGVSPIPYKVFTIAAGVAGMALVPFLLASLIGRGLRFFAVALVIRWGGERMETTLRHYIEYIGWLLVAAIVVIYVVSR